MEKDIDDAFEEVLFAEQNIIKKNYEKGFMQGASNINVEGFHLGYHRGAELGSELGYYSGVIDNFFLTFRSDMKPSKKIVPALTELKQMIEIFPIDNAENANIIELASDIRMKFKRIRTFLKINTRFPRNDNLSF